MPAVARGGLSSNSNISGRIYAWRADARVSVAGDTGSGQSTRAAALPLPSHRGGKVWFVVTARVQPSSQLLCVLNAKHTHQAAALPPAVEPQDA